MEHEGCPVFPSFRPLDPEQVIDPYPQLAVARREEPVFYMPDYDVWVVTRYEDIEEVLRDTDTFSSADFVDFPPFPPEVANQLVDGHPLENTLVSTDPPAHTRIRKRAQKAFTPRQAEARAPAVRELAHDLVDGFAATGSTDLGRSYCTQIPIRVVGPILGVSMEEAAQLYQWATEALILVGNARQMDETQLLDYGRGQVEFDRFIRDLVRDRRANPRSEDDLVTSLIEAEGEDGEPALAESEIVGIVAAALAAGSDTSAATMANCVFSLLEERSRWEEILAEPGLIPGAIEETVRAKGAARTIPRTATRDCELAGVKIPKGAEVLVHLGSGSHDERRFEDGESFDLHRANAKQHLGFGKWMHFCIGAPLARMELRVAIEVLAERLPDLRPSPGAAIEYFPSLQVLPVVSGPQVEWSP